MELATQIFINSLPILLLIGVWIYFMKKMRPATLKQQEYLRKHLEMTERMVVALEKMAEKAGARVAYQRMHSDSKKRHTVCLRKSHATFSCP